MAEETCAEKTIFGWGYDNRLVALCRNSAAGTWWPVCKVLGVYPQKPPDRAGGLLRSWNPAPFFFLGGVHDE